MKREDGEEKKARRGVGKSKLFRGGGRRRGPEAKTYVRLGGARTFLLLFNLSAKVLTGLNGV